MSALQEQVGGDHYKDCPIQPVEYIHANGLGFIEGNVVKYITRWRSKGGLKDLAKIKHFIDLLMELETRQKKTATVVRQPLTDAVEQHNAQRKEAEKKAVDDLRKHQESGPYGRPLAPPQPWPADIPYPDIFDSARDPMLCYPPLEKRA